MCNTYIDDYINNIEIGDIVAMDDGEHEVIYYDYYIIQLKSIDDDSIIKMDWGEFGENVIISDPEEDKAQEMIQAQKEAILNL